MKKIIGLCLAMLMASGAVKAATSDFSSYTAGASINGQDGWTTTDQWGNDAWGNTGTAFDEAIVDLGSNKVWRVSNAVTTGGLSAQPFSFSSEQVAGETGAALWNDYGPDHTSPLRPPLPGAYATTNCFYGQFDFKSATGGAQAGLQIQVSPGARQVDGRMSYIQLVDDGANGFDLFFYETGSVDNIWGNSSIEIASDLSYTDYHSIGIGMEFVDGLNGNYGNDVVSVYVDGVLVHTGTSWETWARSGPYSSGELHAVDALGFNLRGSAANVAGGGFYIDNVIVSNECMTTTVPAPGALLLAGIGTACVGRIRRYTK